MTKQGPTVKTMTVWLFGQREKAERSTMKSNSVMVHLKVLVLDLVDVQPHLVLSQPPSLDLLRLDLLQLDQNQLPVLTEVLRHKRRRHSERTIESIPTIRVQILN